MSMLSDLGMIILNRIGNKPIELLFDIDADIPSKLYGDALRIREEDLGKLFGTFQQVDTKKNHHKEGSGLGLSISKQLVELMHGRIGVNSEYGKGNEEQQRLAECGAVVCSMLNPMIENRENVADYIKGRPATEKAAEYPKEFSGEDSQIPEELAAEEMLKPLKMQIETASDGIEAVMELRKLEEQYYKKVPVIALTGNTAKEQREEYIQAGMSDYLSKPIDMEDIHRTVKKWIPDKILVCT